MLFGLAPWAADAAEPDDEPSLLDQVELAERLGFHSIWFPELHFSGRGSTPAPLLLLAAAAARTSRLRLGTTSYLLPIRHPVQVAEEIAVLDRLSNGRTILGVGRGFRPALFETFGVPSAEKRQRFEAALETILRAWRGEAVAYLPAADQAGEPTPVRVSPTPVQQPHPPIWVAAFGPRALAQAGRLGLPYLASPVESLPRLIENYARHREACGDAVDLGVLPIPIMRTVFATRDESAERRVREALAKQATALLSARPSGLRSAGTAELDDWALVGRPEAVAEQIERYREKLGVTHLIVRARVPAASSSEVAGSIHEIAELMAKFGPV